MIPSEFFVIGSYGLVVLGLPYSRSRLKMLTNSPRICRFMLSLIRKLRPIFAFSDGFRRPRKFLRKSFPEFPQLVLTGHNVQAAGFSKTSVYGLYLVLTGDVLVGCPVLGLMYKGAPL